jgi:hypothetical protein
MGKALSAVHIIKRASTGSSIKVELVSGSRVVIEVDDVRVCAQRNGAQSTQ